MKYGISPLYQVIEQIECYILQQGLQSHDKFPGERKLCEIFDCNRVTLRNAFECLERAEKTYSIRGMGNYVAEKKIEIPLVRYDSFYQHFIKLKEQPVLEVLSVEKEKVGPKIARHLAVPDESLVWKSRTLLSLKDIPVVFETSWISAEKYSDITKDELYKKEIYQVFQECYGIVLEYGGETIGITTAQPEEAEYLEISDNTPLFFVQKAGGTKDETVIYSRAVVRPDKLQFSSILK